MLAHALAVSLVILAAKAPKVAPDQQAYDRAKAAYDEVQYGEAIGVLDGLLGRSDLSPALRSKATLLIGFCHVGLGNIEAAERRFREVLKDDLDLKLPPGTSPKIKDQFERVRSLVLREKVREAEKPKVDAPVEVKPATAPTIMSPPPVEQPPPVTVKTEETPVYKKAWFWVVIAGGAALVGGAIATGVVVADRNTSRPGGLEVEITQ